MAGHDAEMEALVAAADEPRRCMRRDGLCARNILYARLVLRLYGTTGPLDTAPERPRRGHAVWVAPRDRTASPLHPAAAAGIKYNVYGFIVYTRGTRGRAGRPLPHVCDINVES